MRSGAVGDYSGVVEIVYTILLVLDAILITFFALFVIKRAVTNEP